MRLLFGGVSCGFLLTYMCRGWKKVDKHWLKWIWISDSWVKVLLWTYCTLYVLYLSVNTNVMWPTCHWSDECTADKHSFQQCFQQYFKLPFVWFGSMPRKFQKLLYNDFYTVRFINIFSSTLTPSANSCFKNSHFSNGTPAYLFSLMDNSQPLMYLVSPWFFKYIFVGILGGWFKWIFHLWLICPKCRGRRKPILDNLIICGHFIFQVHNRRYFIPALIGRSEGVLCWCSLLQTSTHTHTHIDLPVSHSVNIHIFPNQLYDLQYLRPFRHINGGRPQTSAAFKPLRWVLTVC